MSVDPRPLWYVDCSLLTCSWPGTGTRCADYILSFKGNRAKSKQTGGQMVELLCSHIPQSLCAKTTCRHTSLHGSCTTKRAFSGGVLLIVLLSLSYLGLVQSSSAYKLQRTPSFSSKKNAQEPIFNIWAGSRRTREAQASLNHTQAAANASKSKPTVSLGGGQKVGSSWFGKLFGMGAAEGGDHAHTRNMHVTEQRLGHIAQFQEFFITPQLI